MPTDDRIIASRTLDTDDGPLTLTISDTTADIPAFRYELNDAAGTVTESKDFYGEDPLQALLFAITAAGDHLQRFVPSASWLGLGSHGLLTTDLSAAGWRAEVSLPAADPDDPKE